MTSTNRPEWLAAMSKAKAAAIAKATARSRVFPAQSAAAPAMASDESSKALGAPIEFSSGTTARQAAAPPARSAPYKTEIAPGERAKSTENSNPVQKNGTAVAR